MHIAVAQSFEVFFHNVFCGAQADIVVGREDIEAHGFQVPASLPDYPGFFEREERASKVDFRHVAIAVPLNRRYPARSGLVVLFCLPVNSAAASLGRLS